MAKIQTRNKQNPKLQQSELKDGRASLYLEYYLGRTETPVLDDEGNQVYYTTGAMAENPNTRSSTTAEKKTSIFTYGYIREIYKKGRRTRHPRTRREDTLITMHTYKIGIGLSYSHLLAIDNIDTMSKI